MSVGELTLALLLVLIDASLPDIAAQKGEFVVWYNIKQSDAPCRRLKVLVDGNPARHYHFRPVHCNVDHKCEGWLVNPTTTRRFAFGDIEVNNGGY